MLIAEITESWNGPTVFPLVMSLADTASSIGRVPLIGLDRNELQNELLQLGEPAYRTKQLWHWLYHRGAATFDEMTTLPKSLRQTLNEYFTIQRPNITRQQDSQDGAKKWLVEFDDGNEAECVHIPEEDRGALCISSQVGCTLTCKFCHTGTQKLVRNLKTKEIVEQLLIARDSIGEWPSSSDQRLISNVVMMGMGEPLYNYENVARALHIVMDAEGLALSKRKITLSTAGVVPLIERCGRELGVNLAVSLHAVTNELRSRIVPLNKKYPIEWVDLNNVDSIKDDLRYRGYNQGAAIFARPEGMWYDNDMIYFTCTSGGVKKLGQIWKINITQQTLELIFESHNSNIMKACDNITISPWGDLIVSEDGKGSDRLVGIKSREVYECPAAIVLHEALSSLESLSLSKNQLRFKRQVGIEYSELVYNGLWYSQHRENLEAYLQNAQRFVSGTVKVKFHKGNCIVIGRKSKYSLYDYQLATYDDSDSFDHKSAVGFIKIFSLPTTLQKKNTKK